MGKKLFERKAYDMILDLRIVKRAAAERLRNSCYPREHATTLLRVGWGPLAQHAASRLQVDATKYS